MTDADMAPCVLVVEDEALLALSLEGALSAAGYAVCGPTATAAEALKLAERRPPKLAIVNINLRDGRGAGIELARELLDRWGVPSLFVSGQRTEAHANRDAALGYIGKPYRPETVLKSVEVALLISEGRSPPPAAVPRELELFQGADDEALEQG